MKHISDHSASNHKIQVIQRLIDIQNKEQLSPSGTIQVLLIALKDSRRLILLRPGHESLWYHRRCVIEIMLSNISEWKLQDAQFVPYIITSFQQTIELILKDSIEAEEIEKFLEDFSDIRTDKSLSKFITQFLESEAAFISRVLVGDIVWDQRDQQRHLKSYFNFVCSRVRGFLHY